MAERKSRIAKLQTQNFIAMGIQRTSFVVTMGQLTNTAKSDAPLHRRDRPIRNFLDKLYWTLGVFCFLWASSVVIGVLRRTPLELPVFGKTQLSETIIFTQIAFCVLLPPLFLIILVFRAASAKRNWGTRFPGTPAEEWEIPNSFAWLRVAIFLGLTIFPTATMVFCCVRMEQKLNINANGASPILTKWEMFRSPPQRPQDPYDWRWSGEDANLPLETRAKVSAFPCVEPWIFALFSGGSSLMALYLLFVPIRKTRSGQAKAQPLAVGSAPTSDLSLTMEETANGHPSMGAAATASPAPDAGPPSAAVKIRE